MRNRLAAFPAVSCSLQGLYPLQGARNALSGGRLTYETPLRTPAKHLQKYPPFFRAELQAFQKTLQCLAGVSCTLFFFRAVGIPVRSVARAEEAPPPAPPGLIGSGGHPGPIAGDKGGVGLRILCEQNRISPISNAELQKIHQIKRTFNAGITSEDFK